MEDSEKQLFLSLTCHLSSDRLVMSCCNRWASQSSTRGDSGHSAWHRYAVTNTHARRTHTWIHTITRTHTHMHSEWALGLWREKDKDIIEEWGRSGERRAAGSEREHEVTEGGYLGNQASGDNCLISGWTVRYPGWFPRDVCAFPLWVTAAKDSLFTHPLKDSLDKSRYCI